MNLSEEQKAIVAGWIKEGATAGEVQKRLKEQLGISLTYLQLRLLMDDLQVVPAEPEPEQNQKPQTAQDELSDSSRQSAKELEDEEDAEFFGSTGTGKVSVSLDQITRAGALASGKVTFSDGKKADWYLDAMGRLGLNPETPGYRPTEQDVMAFQIELQKAARRAGLM